MLARLTVEEATQRLRDGQVVVFPTETCYGIGCRAYDEDAVDCVVQVKGRPDGKPLPILLPSAEALRAKNLESPLYTLAEAFWPGPLTLVVPAFPGLPAPITAGTNMVGVRVSAHPIAQALVQALGAPLVGTSANRTGEPAATDPAGCDAAFKGVDGIAGMVDGGTTGGSASTVVGLVDGDLRIHRDGPISEAQLREVWDAARALY